MLRALVFTSVLGALLAVSSCGSTTASYPHFDPPPRPKRGELGFSGYTAIAHFERKIVLDRKHPVDDELDIELVRVSRHGHVTLLLRKEQRLITARVRGVFPGFGRIGLVVKSASHRKQAAKLIHRGATSTSTTIETDQDGITTTVMDWDGTTTTTFTDWDGTTTIVYP